MSPVANNLPTLIFIVEYTLDQDMFTSDDVKLQTSASKKLVFHCPGKFPLSILNSQSPLFPDSHHAPPYPRPLPYLLQLQISSGSPATNVNLLLLLHKILLLLLL